MANANPSTFLVMVIGILQKMENSDFYSFFHVSAITVSLSESLLMTYGIKFFSSFGIANLNP